MSQTPRFVALTTIALTLFSAFGSAQSSGRLHDEGIEALESRHFHQAVKLFSELVKTRPSAANFAYLAIAENGVKDFAASIADYERAIKLGDDSVLTRFGLGTTYLEDGKPLAAAQQLRLALERDPNYIPARYALGVALVNANQPRQAIPYLESARRASEGYAQYWVTLVRAQFEAGNGEAGVEDAHQAIASIPENEELASALAALCAQYQQFDAARNFFETSLELQPNNFKVRLGLARVCLRTGDPGELLEVLSNLPPRVGNTEEVVILTTEARALTGNTKAAKSGLAAALHTDPDNPRYLLIAAWLDETQGHYRRALAALRGIHHAGAMEPQILYQIAVSHYFLRHYALAASTCAAVVHFLPNDGQAYSLLGLSRLAQGEVGAAAIAFEKAVALNPKAAAYHRELGEALLKEGALKKSEAELIAALRLDPREPEAYYWQAQAFTRSRQPQKAIDSLQTAIALDPNFAEAYVSLAHLYSAQGETEQAKAILAQEKRRANAKPVPENRSLPPGAPMQ
jgi:predicted Zn-dependent protease